MRTLVYGIGNPGRQDDALGIMLTDRLTNWVKNKGIENIEFDQNYQLNIEDAERISNFERVFFVDASVVDIESVFLEAIKPNLQADFSMHSVAPEYVVGLCHEMFSKTPACYQLHLKGHSFEFMQELTPQAEKNLEEGFELLIKILLNPCQTTVEQV